MADIIMSDMILLSFISFIIYLNSLDCHFVFDDFSAIINNHDVISMDWSLSSLLLLFQHDYWGTAITSELSHKSYRPLTVLTFKLNHFIDGTNPFGYHLVNIILHTIVTCLFYVWCIRINFNKEASLIAGLLFATQPIHTEAV